MKLFSILEQLHHYSWRHVLERMGLLKGTFLRLSYVITGHPTVEVGLSAVHLAKQVWSISRKSGLLFCALYLKQCAVHLQRFYSRSSDFKAITSLSFPVSVSLTRRGIPRIIPVRHRHCISVRDQRADYLVRWYLSCFTLAKIIRLAKQPSFDSIIGEARDIESVREVLGWIKMSKPFILPLYLPWIHTIPLNKGLSWIPTWKSLPNSDRLFDKKIPSNVFSSLKREIASFAGDVNKIHSLEGIFSPGMLFAKRTLWPLCEDTTRGLHEDMEFYERNVGIVFSDLAQAFKESSARLYPGRLAQVVEGAGKRRIFAIGNYIKQRLLYPVHEWAMAVLRRIPSDGTFHQERPIHRLVQRGHQERFSFDLKSATDRWPLSVIHDVFGLMFGPTMASCTVNGTLGLNTFWVGPPAFQVKPSLKWFATGQPLGYYGSWALFALSHHYMVWLAAHLVNPSRKAPFRAYALLGDDIVIADKAVANRYQDLLNRIGVLISEPKSLVSDNGSLEFAKQFWCGQRNLSPISVKALLVSRSVLGLCSLSQKYNIPFKGIVRLGGGGFRVLANLDNPLGKKWRRLKAAAGKPGLEHTDHLEWWIGRGLPLNPYIKGRMVSMLMRKLRPRQLRVPPCPEVVFEGEAANLEYTLYRNWVSQWLKWLLWYSRLHLLPDSPLGESF